jgi:hypothetical protein
MHIEEEDIEIRRSADPPQCLEVSHLSHRVTSPFKKFDQALR